MTSITNFLYDAFAMLVLAIFAAVCIGVALSPFAMLALCFFGR